ncbi:MAG: hypothetical protein AMK69_02830 [Nitrospira bacterium SG8_3]|jgi:hypothetical protein|nr:MAG: hypothetical protein AMK69_02830 [Nitrospira bacterium SG8_3]
MRQRVLNQTTEKALSASSEDIAKALKSKMDHLKLNFYDMEKGGANYESMKHSNAFEDYVSATKALTVFDLNTLTSREAKLAFWINIYNALVVHGILELNIKKSVKEVSSFFNTVCYDVGGHIFSLDDIEHGILRGNKKKHFFSHRPFSDSDPRKRSIIETVDPRIHFALVCGSNSCPPIDVYEAGEIDEQLELVTSGFVNSDEVILDKESKKLMISRIFEWYEDDFGGKEAVLSLITKYRYDPEEKAFLQNAFSELRIAYKDYDWSLNVV